MHATSLRWENNPQAEPRQFSIILPKKEGDGMTDTQALHLQQNA
jgi:hypothetical protein